MIGEIFNILLLQPLLNALLFLYMILGNNFTLAIAVLTVVLRLATQPFMAKQMHSSKRMSELQPQIKELQKKYANDKERLAKEQMKLYKENGVSPMAGCLPMLLQFPIWIALYQAITQILGRTPTQLMSLSKHVYDVGIFSNLSSLIPLSSQFLWLDLARPDPYYIIPILVAVTQWAQQKMMSPAVPADGDNTQAQMSQSMMMMMPLMFGFITINLASGLGLYFAITSLVGIVVQYFTTGWGGLLPQRAAATGTQEARQGVSLATVGATLKRLFASAQRGKSVGPVTATQTSRAGTQPAAGKSGGGPGEAKTANADPAATPVAAVQKGTKRGSRKKKR